MFQFQALVSLIGVHGGGCGGHSTTHGSLRATSATERPVTNPPNIVPCIPAFEILRLILSSSPCCTLVGPPISAKSLSLKLISRFLERASALLRSQKFSISGR